MQRNALRRCALLLRGRGPFLTHVSLSANAFSALVPSPRRTIPHSIVPAGGGVGNERLKRFREDTPGTRDPENLGAACSRGNDRLRNRTSAYYVRKKPVRER